jgi:outer membrane protein OmpA-like peptidoglycan-associated protein
LNNIFFDYNSAQLRSSSTSELARLVTLLNQHPSMTIEVGGHTDNVGSDQFNLELSVKRAKAVCDYLVRTGKVDPSRIFPKGYGASRFAASNDTEDGRQENRRVAFTVISLGEK